MNTQDTQNTMPIDLHDAIVDAFDLPHCITTLGVPADHSEMEYNTRCEVTGQYGATWCVEYSIDSFNADGSWRKTIDSGFTNVCHEVLDAHHNGTQYTLEYNEYGEVTAINYKED